MLIHLLFYNFKNCSNNYLIFIIRIILCPNKFSKSYLTTEKSKLDTLLFAGLVHITPK
jgi:hypothetical protein